MQDTQPTVNGVSRQKLLEEKQNWVEARKREGVEGVYKAQAMALPLPPILHDALRVPRAERAVIGVLDRKRFVLDGGERADWDPVARARVLVESGCTALMICSDSCAHDGAYDDILAVAQHIEVPIIAGDYVLDTVQITMARAHGAAAIVLSAALHNDRALKKLYRAAVQLQLDVILDVAAAKHVDSATQIRVGQGPTGAPRLFGADIFGFAEPDVRRLHDRVAPAIPEEALAIACVTEGSGLRLGDSVKHGYEAFLVCGSQADQTRAEEAIGEIAGLQGGYALEATNT